MYYRGQEMYFIFYSTYIVKKKHNQYLKQIMHCESKLKTGLNFQKLENIDTFY